MCLERVARPHYLYYALPKSSVIFYLCKKGNTIKFELNMFLLFQ